MLIIDILQSPLLDALNVLHFLLSLLILSPLLSFSLSFCAGLLDAYHVCVFLSKLLLFISACLILLPLKLFAAIFLWTLFTVCITFLKVWLGGYLSLLVVYYFYYLTLHQLLYRYIHAYKRFSDYVSDRFFQLFQLFLGLLELLKSFSLFFSTPRTLPPSFSLSQNSRVMLDHIVLLASPLLSLFSLILLFYTKDSIFMSFFLFFSSPIFLFLLLVLLSPLLPFYVKYVKQSPPLLPLPSPLLLFTTCILSILLISLFVYLLFWF